MAPETLIRCGDCGAQKDAVEFGRYVRRGQTRIRGRCRDCHNAYNRENHRKLKLAVVRYYGGACACCGDEHTEFLAIDHIEGGGNRHRASLGTGASFYRWLVREGFPEGFRVLCHNCNMAIGQHGASPHQLEATIGT